MNHQRLLGMLLSFIALFTGMVHGQPEGRFPLRVMALSESGLPEVYVKAGANYVLLEFSATQPSLTVQASHANPLPLYRLQETADGRKDYAVISKVTLPESGKGILLLGWGTTEKASYLPISDDFSGASSADWLVINATTKPLAMQLGKGTSFVKLPPSGATPFRVMAELSKGAAVTIAEPLAGDRWKTFYSTYWPIYPDRRCLVLFVNTGDKIKVKKISDIKPPPSEHQEAGN